MYVGCGRCEMILPNNALSQETTVCPDSPLIMRAITLGLRQPVVLVSVDMAFLPDGEISKLQELAAISAVTKPERVRIIVTGSISAPSVFRDDPSATEEARAGQKLLKTLLRDTVHTAVLQARANSMDTPFCRPEDESAPLALSGLVLLRFGKESPRAFLLYRSAEKTLSGIPESSDVAATRTCTALEERYPNAVALFLSDPEAAAEFDSLFGLTCLTA